MKTDFASRLLTLAFAFAMAATSRADVSAIVTSVQQNWPWDTRVKVSYEVSGGVCDVTPALVFGGLDLAIKIPQSLLLAQVSNMTHAVKGDVYAVGPGPHELEFDAAQVKFPENVARPTFQKGLSVTLSAKETSFRKYLVLDLTTTPYGVSWLDDVPAGGWTDEYKTSKMVLARIPVYGGTTFEVGAPTNEFGYVESYEKLAFSKLTNDFYMCVFEVTQKQWENVMGSVPSTIAANNVGDTKPVTKVSWLDFMGVALDANGYNWPSTSAVSSDCFVGKLRANTTLPACFFSGYKFNLPTQVQWEFACRGGVMNTWYTGADISVTLDMTRTGTARQYDENVESIAWYPHNTDRLKPVGGKLPNPYGIYDMIGNASEWCVDYALVEPCPSGTEPVGKEPPKVANAPLRALRGGNYASFLFASTTYGSYTNINISAGGSAFYGLLTQRPAFKVRGSWTDKHDFIGGRVVLAYTRIAENVAQ